MDRHDDYITQALAVQGGHLAIGRGGFTLHFKRGATLSGYDSDEMKDRCIARGLPVIDTREIPLDILTVEVIRNPLIAVRRSRIRSPGAASTRLRSPPSRAATMNGRVPDGGVGGGHRGGAG